MEKDNLQIRHVMYCDKEFWFSLDKHLSESEFDRKVEYKQGYVLSVNGKRIGLLRYNLFWDNTPFCALLFIDKNFQRKGYGKMLASFWEEEMRALGYDWLLVSTQSDESAQFFYRALGWEDCGCLLAPNHPSEIFLGKHLK